jgi:hypothetical protein
MFRKNNRGLFRDLHENICVQYTVIVMLKNVLHIVTTVFLWEGESNVNLNQCYYSPYFYKQVHFFRRFLPIYRDGKMQY